MTVRDWIDYYKGIPALDRDELRCAYQTLLRDERTRAKYLGDFDSHIYALNEADLEMRREIKTEAV